MANFLNPAAIDEAHRVREAAQVGTGWGAVALQIKKAFAHPLHGDPVALAKVAQDATSRVTDTSRVPASPRAQDPNCDDALDKDDMDLDEDEDEDAAVTGTEHADIETRRKLRAKADRKKNARPQLEATQKMIMAIRAKGARVENPDWRDAAAKTRMEYRDDRPSFIALKKALARPLSLSPNKNYPIDEAQIQRIIAEGKGAVRKAAGIPSDIWNRATPQERIAMVRKADSTIRFSSRPTFPANSANQSLDNQPWADTGNTNSNVNRDQPVPSQRFADTLGGFTDSAVPQSDPRIRAAVATGSSDSNRDAATDAIKMDLMRPRRLL